MRKKKKPVRLPRITAKVASKVLEVVDAGLSSGLGTATPGSMCVEAAVCYAMGEPHTDQPRCVLHSVRDLKIALNDHFRWAEVDASTASLAGLNLEAVKAERSKGLRRLAIAQLGSMGKITREKWDAALKEYYLKKNRAAREELKRREQAKAQDIARVEKLLKDGLADLKKGLDVNVEAYYDPADHAPDYEDLHGEIINMIKTKAQLKRTCEDIVQILIKLRSPGTKYLYLTTKSRRKPKVAKRKAAKKK